MLVEMHSDVVCPWCFVGLRRFQAARAARPDLELDARFLPFELNPDLPAGGVDRIEHLRRKFGGAAQLAAAEARLEEIGSGAGIAFRFDRITRTPNTRTAHCLIADAAATGRAETLVEALFSAYFERGRDVGDPAVLLDIGRNSGLDADALEAIVYQQKGCDAIARAELAAVQLGIRGVPAFVLAGRYLVCGAQPVDVLIEVADRVAAAGSGAS